MLKFRKIIILALLLFALGFSAFLTAAAWNPMPVSEDPLVRMPGTQPRQVSLESANRCLNCHAGYNQAVEPGYNWQGSMMAQSARDFLFFSCLTVAAQDSIWAVGTPNAVDLCERCHFPKGWLEGRSDPPNASAMTGADYEGVQCDFCHRLLDPFFEDTYAGIREGDDWLHYWDETNLSVTPSQPAALATYNEDMAIAQSIKLFNGGDFFVNNKPLSLDYRESGAGQYFVSPSAAKRASFADAEARHQMFYSRFHKSKYFCNACHDVSNPVLANLGQDGSSPLTTETTSAYNYYHVERTFSEFMLSAYGQQGGAAGKGPFAPNVFQTSQPDNYIRMCQDCHMRDVVGEGANKRGLPIRPNDSIEHPESGQPLHDLTGGNVWVPWVLASAIPGSPNYDATNDTLINQGPAILTLDLTQGAGLDPAALLSGVDRAKQQLQLAATIDNVSYGNDGTLSFRIQNQTGHKLISGFPEGRRMFVNIKVYDGDTLIYEVNPYDAGAGTLKGLEHALSSPSLGTNEIHVKELVYEMHPSSTLTGEDKTFHFALANGRYKDNRIPPKGFRIAEAANRLAQPVWGGVDKPDYFTAAEYAGGYDEVSVQVPSGGTAVEINLYYQTTSREYVEFLRDEINGTGELTLDSPTPSGEASAYIIQTDPFFSQLKGWGDTLWQLWWHNKDIHGAAPFLMTQAVVGSLGTTCDATAPTLTSAVPGNQQVALAWSHALAADPDTSYNLYYDQAGKAQLVTAGLVETTYTNTGLTNGQEYCYKVTYVQASNPTCESASSNILCAIPNNQGQSKIGAEGFHTGLYVKTGKGKDQTTIFEPTSTFAQGDQVVFRIYLYDVSTHLPVSNATATVAISGPESITVTTAASGGDGWAEGTWQTQSPNKRGQGGTTPGTYTATVTQVTASGYAWDQVSSSLTFTLN